VGCAEGIGSKGFALVNLGVIDRRPSCTVNDDVGADEGPHHRSSVRDVRLISAKTRDVFALRLQDLDYVRAKHARSAGNHPSHGA
jgi:hypothetical protein